MATKWQRVAIEIPKEYGPTEREAIAQDVIDLIIERSQAGKDRDGKKFKSYTKDYAAQKGVGRSEVDLTLSSEMLNSIELISSRSGKVIIGFENGSQENAKADGNIRGTYGQSEPIPGKARDFLGVRDSELKRILKNYPIQDRELSLEQALEKLIANRAANAALGDVLLEI